MTTVYALCYHYDSFGGDDTSVLGLFSTEEKANAEGKKQEAEAQKFWKEEEYCWGRPAMPTFTGMLPPKHYGDYYIKLMEIN